MLAQAANAASEAPQARTAEPTPSEDSPEPVSGPRANPQKDAYVRSGPLLEIVARMRTGSLPKSVEVSPSGEHIVVANFGWKNRKNLWRWRTDDYQREGQLVFRGNAVESLFSADGSSLFVSSFSGSRVVRADAATLKVTTSYVVDDNPKVMALSPDERFLYVANWSSDSVSVVDLDKGKAVGHRFLGHHPRGMVVGDDGTVFVSAMYRHQIHVLRHLEHGPKAFEELRVLDVCRFPRHTVWSPDKAALIVSCSGEDRLAWYDPETGAELDTAPVGDNPRSTATSVDGRYIAVADFDGGSVSLVDTARRQVHAHPIERAKHVVGIAVKPSGADEPLEVYATNWSGNELLVLRAGQAAP